MLLLNPLFPVLEGNGTGTINLKLIVNLLFSALEEDGTGDTGVVTSGNSQTADPSLPVKIPGKTKIERQQDAAERRGAYRR